ncbi:MAG: hypothetical protein GF311_05680 [Candidatus Lokiarchaeota archaeon]|nr:hypothetical protein [Candidatus Lokiarchaeota archaeon]
MPRSYKFKIIMGGVSNPEIIPFFDNSEFNGEDFSHIGITINSIECMTNLADSYLFILWHLNQKERFEFMLSSFCHGAKGGLICIDKSSMESYQEAIRWITLFRNEIKNIPLIILSFQSDATHREVANLKIKRLFERYRINGHFNITAYEKINYLLKKDFFKFLIEVYNGQNTTEFSDLSLLFPKEEKDFIAFLENYQICPLCKEKNHIDNLKDFYFSQKKEVMLLRERFFELKDKYRHLKPGWTNSLNLGILCCSCYKKNFRNAKS